MNKEQLKTILPHRDAMLLIDEAELRDGKAFGKYTFRGDEWFFNGHFPGNPVVPGVIYVRFWRSRRLFCWAVKKRRVPFRFLRALRKSGFVNRFAPVIHLKLSVKS